MTDEVRYGTNGGSNLDRDGLSVPARSDTELRTSYSYATDGTLHEVTDPRALVTRYEYDAAGRKTKEIRNYVDGTPSGTDEDQTVVYAYTDGLLTSLTADMPSGQTDQTTTYTYGTTKGASAGDSKIATGHLLQKKQYPDSGGGTDVITYAYNAQGERNWQKDQAGNVTETDFDDAGRPTQSRVTTLASGFNGDIRRIACTYTDLGQPRLVTQYDNAVVGSGTAQDEIRCTYDGWGSITSLELDRNGPVDESGSIDDYEVSYTYETSTDGRNSIRKTGVTLPSGNVLTYQYKSNDKASRLYRVKDGTVIMADYAYLGKASLVATRYAQAEISSKRHGSTSGSYPDLDRFNRATSSRWTSDLTTPIDFYDFDVSYDRNSNVTLVVDNVHTGFDVSFSMDDLDRLVEAEEGTWSGSAITSKTRFQDWTLSHTGNWDHARLDLDGNGTYATRPEYDDKRTSNAVNELTARDIDNDSTDDYTLGYDAVGTLTDDGESYKYEYDPFGRLRKIKDRSDDTLVAEYVYNGLGFMISAHEDTDTDGDVDADDLWYHHAYDESWRMLATYREDDSDPKEEFVFHDAGPDGMGGSSYINALLCRDKDSNTAWTSQSDGVLEERLYYCQNWRGDVVALVHKTRKQVESVRYSSYGVPLGIPEPDTNSDMIRNAADLTQFDTWINSSTYNVRGDCDLDGDVDASDKSLAITYGAKTLGWDAISWVSNETGYAAYTRDATVGLYHVRWRALALGLGVWMQRDPLGYRDSANLYQYARSEPVVFVDPLGKGVYLVERPISGQPSFVTHRSVVVTKGDKKPGEDPSSETTCTAYRGKDGNADVKKSLPGENGTKANGEPWGGPEPKKINPPRGVDEETFERAVMQECDKAQKELGGCTHGGDQVTGSSPQSFGHFFWWQEDCWSVTRKIIANAQDRFPCDSIPVSIQVRMTQGAL